MIKKSKSILTNYLGLFIVGLFLPIKSLGAESIMEILNGARTTAGYGEASIDTVPGLVGTIISVVLGFIGAIFFILVIVSGIQWMTAGGSEEKVTHSRTRLINAVIGLAITVSAYFVTKLISDLAIG